MLGFFACSTAVLAAIHWHDAAALAAARMAAVMLRLRCLAWLLYTGDGSACSGAQTRSDGICCSSSGSSNGWAGADALSCGARSRAELAAVLRHTVTALAAAGMAAAMHGLAFDAITHT